MAFVLIGLGKGDRGDDHIKCGEEVGHFFRIDVQCGFHNGEIVNRKKGKTYNGIEHPPKDSRCSGFFIRFFIFAYEVGHVHAEHRESSRRFAMVGWALSISHLDIAWRVRFNSLAKSS